jgi:hypothetical protein
MSQRKTGVGYMESPLLLQYVCCKSSNPVTRLSTRRLARNFLSTELFQDVYCTTAKMYLEKGIKQWIKLPSQNLLSTFNK